MLALLSCATKPVTQYQNYTSGHWDGRALIKSFESGKAFVVGLDIVAVRPDRFRMDVTSTLGAHEATLTISNSEIRYLIVRERIFYHGRASPNNMARLIKVPLDPTVFTDLLFDVEPPRPWKCQRDKKNLLKTCVNSETSVVVDWTERKGAGKNIEIRAPHAVVQMNLKDFTPNVEKGRDFFEIQPPAHFRVISEI